MKQIYATIELTKAEVLKALTDHIFKQRPELRKQVPNQISVEVNVKPEGDITVTLANPI